MVTLKSIIGTTSLFVVFAPKSLTWKWGEEGEQCDRNKDGPTCNGGEGCILNNLQTHSNVLV